MKKKMIFAIFVLSILFFALFIFNLTKNKENHGVVLDGGIEMEVASQEEMLSGLNQIK